MGAKIRNWKMASQLVGEPRVSAGCAAPAAQAAQAAFAVALAFALAFALAAIQVSWTSHRAYADEGSLQAGSAVELVTQAIASVTTSDGWVWRASEDGASATIVGYVGSSAAPSVPAAIDGKPVVGVIAKMSTGSPALTDINLSAASDTLSKLQVRGCKLTSLDVSGVAGLTYLDVCDNDLAMLKVPSGLVELRCSDNELSSLNVSACSVLEKLDCAANQVRALDISACPSLYYLDCSDNYLSDLKCGANLQLGDVFCSGNYISEDLATLVARYGSDNGVIVPQNAGDPPAAQSNTSGDSQGGSSSSSSSASASSTAKKANTLTVKAKAVKVKASKVKKKAQKVSASTAFAVSGAQGSVTYKLQKITVKKTLAKQAKKKIKVAKSGKITLKKGLKKGTYKLKVAVTAAGNASYLPATKVVTLKVKVK